MRAIFLVKSQSAVIDSVISRFFFFDIIFLVYKNILVTQYALFSHKSAGFAEFSSAGLRYWVESDAGLRYWEIASKNSWKQNDQLFVLLAVPAGSAVAVTQE